MPPSALFTLTLLFNSKNLTLQTKFNILVRKFNKMKWTLLLASIIFFTQALYAQVEELTFTSEEWELNGSLYLPEGEGPFKAAVLVHGSGPIDRYQTIPLTDPNSQCINPQLFGDTVRNFLDIALHLQASGIAVFTYDKRTLTHGVSLDPITVSPLDFVKDAENAVNYLSTRAEIDEDQIFLIGHSQGAGLIPVIAQNVAVAGLISLAGAVTTPDTLVANQFKDLYVQCTGYPENGDIIAENFFNEFSKIRNFELADTQQIFIEFPNNPNLIPYGFPIFWTDWFEITDNVISNYNNAALPTLIIHGTDDWNVPVDDAYRLENGLSFEPLTVEIFDGINHYLTPADDPKVDPTLLQTISNWLVQDFPTNIELPKEFQSISVTYNKNQISINTLVNLDAVFISTIDGKILRNLAEKKAGLHNIEMQTKHKIIFVSFIKDANVLTKKLLTF